MKVGKEYKRVKGARVVPSGSEMIHGGARTAGTFEWSLNEQS